MPNIALWFLFFNTPTAVLGIRRIFVPTIIHMPTKNDKSYFSSNFTLGILGGGQLGKMMLYETRKFDIKTKVLDASDEAPCKIACNDFVKGDLMDYDTVIKFAEDVDVLTIEIENVNVDALEQLENEGKTVYPPTKALRTIQNKATQKLFYVDNGIPTADFSRFAYKSEIKDSIENASLQFR